MRVGIAGCGLIGGSLALALRAGHQVTAYDPAGTGDIPSAKRVEDLLSSDVVVVATPLDAVVPTLRGLAAHSGATVLMDVGSLKRDVNAFAASAPETARIVGGHPMAGTTERGSMAVAGDLARAVGAIPTVVSAAEHDRIVAVLSGLPLLVARALARVGADVADLAGPGFRDATRLAKTPPELADALLHGNATEIRAALAKLRTALDEAERAL